MSGSRRPSAQRPLIVGIGGTASPGSTTEQALKLALRSANAAGANIQMFGASELINLPHYLTDKSRDTPVAVELVRAVRAADGLVIASPGYHGSISGLVKNAIDYLEETARDGRPYLDGLPVGVIATAYGWQATGSTIAALRSIVHALRGWPTPLGVAINSSVPVFREGICQDVAAEAQLKLIGRQVVEFAKLRLVDPSSTDTGEL